METIDRADAYALLAEGRCVRMRTVTPEDWQTVYDFVATLSPESLYRPFFSVPSRPAEKLANLLCAPRAEQSQPVQGALVALLGGRAVGPAEWYRTGVEGEAEIAFEVSDALVLDGARDGRRAARVPEAVHHSATASGAEPRVAK